MLKLTNIEKSVPFEGGRLWLLRQINLEIAAGDFISITGPSGAGKSTLLHILGLFDNDWTGDYQLLETAVQTLKPAQRQALARDSIGFIFQQYHLLEDLTVAENLDIPLSYRNLPRRERQAKVADTLDRFGIVGKKDLYPNQLSGGQQQLVAVARALIAEPKLLLADEPTGALHSSQGEMIMDLLTELNEAGMTIIQVTHNPVYAARGNREIRLLDGWLENETAGRETA